MIPYRPDFRFNPETQSHEVLGPSSQQIAADVMMAFSRDVEGKTRRALIELGWAPPETRTQAVTALAEAIEAAVRKGVTVQWEPLAAALVAAHDALRNPK